jgi:hypothetical protein
MEKEGYRMAGAPRACYVDGVWNQADPQKWLTIIQVPAEKVTPHRLQTANHLNLFCCPDCGNVALSYGNGKMECCGKIHDPIPVKPCEPADKPSITEMDGEYLLEYNNPMTKDYFIAAVVAERHDNVQLFRLFPEQSAQVRIPILSGTKIYTIYRQGDRIWATLQK